MAYLPTLCEVNYDKAEWWEDTPIPYRYRSLSAKSKDVQYHVPHRELASSASFYEPSTYNRADSVMETRRPPTVFSTYSNQALPPSRACTLPSYYYNSEYPPNSDLYVPKSSREGRVHTAPTSKSLPNLQSRSASSIMLPPYSQPPHSEQKEDKKESLKWVSALNTWVVEKNQNPVPYMTFVNSVNLKERESSDFGGTEDVHIEQGNQPCGRFLSHMNMQQSTTKIIYAQKQNNTMRKRRLQEREEKAQNTRSEPVVRPKSPSRVRFEKIPTPPPPAPQPPQPSLPTPPPPVAPPAPKPVEVSSPKQRTPPPPRRLPTPLDPILATPDPTDDLVEGVRDAKIREPTLPFREPSPFLRKPSPKIPSPVPKDQTLPLPLLPQQSTPLPIEDLESIASPTPPSTPSPRILAPVKREPQPPPVIKTRSKPVKHKPPKTKAPARPKPKPKKQARLEKAPPAKKKKETSLVVNDNPDLFLTVQPQGHNGDEPLLVDEETLEPPWLPQAPSPSPSPPPPPPPPPPLPPISPDLSISTDPASPSPEPFVDLPPVVVRPIIARPLSAISSAHSSDFGDDSSTGSPPSNVAHRREKRVRWRAAKKTEDEPESPREEPKIPVFPKRRVSEWMWSDDDDDFSMPPTPASLRDKDFNSSLDAIPSPSPTPPPSPKPPTPPVEKPKPKPKPKPICKPKKKYGPKKIDKSLQEQMERDRLAEERRQKLSQKRRISIVQRSNSESENQGPRFEDYGFLAKYCIFSKEKYEMYKRIFESVDEEGRGWLSGEEVMLALRVVNKSLTMSEERYITRILEVTGYKASDGADLKLFAVLAAFSQKITSLDEWLRMAIESLDMQRLDLKMYMCKALWEYSVDPDTRTMPIEHLCVELRAGGVSAEHEEEVRDTLQHMRALDLLDFLAYIPLFIMIHESVVSNPLDMTRNK